MELGNDKNIFDFRVLTEEIVLKKPDARSLKGCERLLNPAGKIFVSTGAIL